MLLYLFSMGQSDSMPEFRRRGEAGGSEANAPSRDTSTPPPGKRQSTDPAATNYGPTSAAAAAAAAAAANDLLLELGMPRSVRLLVCDLLNASEGAAFGREAETGAMTEAKDRIAARAAGPANSTSSDEARRRWRGGGDAPRIEAAFLGGCPP